ncbi:MAG: hypothetical protein H6718_16985 [Polyangiaceae bacterium]|nr:hypothetical protein [Myxococcales bacterium]MCB9587096.1 hypothetical protein [Polyangiaceae bacterium]MCB9609529.1 hypothetical protein [Polyangiaceae bacterium]
MISSRGKTLLLASVVCVACGGGATPTPAAPDTDSGQATPIAEGMEGEAAPPLQPVSAPDRVFLVGRLKNPSKLADTVESWVTLPMRWRDAMQQGLPGIERVVDLNAPVDVMVSMDDGGAMQEPKFRAVFSVGLTSLDSALKFSKDQGERAERIAPGVYRVDSDCVVARSLGQAPARLVCGDGKKSIDALLDFATRGLPNEDLGPDDISVEVRAEPFRKRYAADLPKLRRLAMPFIREELQSGFAPFDRAVSDVATALLDEGLALVEDLDALRLKGMLESSPAQARVKFELAFRGKKSWIAQRVEDSGRRAKPAPAMFWDLPRDATSATFGIGGDAAAFAPIQKSLSELLDTYLASQKMAAGPRKNLVGLVDKLWVNEGSSVYASGAVTADTKVKRGTVEFEREVMRSQLAWHVVGLQEDSKRTIAYLDHLVKVSADRNLRAVLKKEVGSDIDKLGPIKRRGPKGKLPRGSVAYEVAIPGDAFRSDDYYEEPPSGAKAQKRPVAKALPVVVIVVPDGPYTWIGMSADETKLVSELAIAAAGTPAKTLATRPDLEKLRTGSFVAGGFVTLQRFTDALKLGVMNAASAKDAEAVLQAMPNRGESPGLIQVQVSAGPTLSYEVVVPKEMITDVGGLIGYGLQSFGAVPPVPMPMPAPPPPVAPRP